jgi:hypothetical protein
MKLKSNQPKAYAKQEVKHIRRATWSDRYLRADHNKPNSGSDGKGCVSA